MHDFISELKSRPAVAKVLKNTAYLTAGRAVSRLATFVMLVLLARWFGPEVYGSYSSIIAFVGMFVFISYLGIEEVVIREVSRDRKKLPEYINKLFPFKLVLALFSMALAIAILMLSNYSENFKALAAIYSLYLLFSGMSELFRYVFNITEKMGVIAAGMLVERFSFVILVLVFLSTLGGVKAVIAATVASSLILLLFYWWESRSVFPFKLVNFDWHFGMRIWNPAKWYALSSVISIGYSQLNTVLLSQLSTFTEVGYFSAASTLYAGFLIPFAAIQSALLPLSSRSSNKSYFRKLGRQCVYFVIAMAALAVLVNIFAGFGVPAIFGQKYAEAIPVLSLMIWALIPSVVFVWCSQLLVSTNNPKWLAFGGFVTAVINIVGNFFLIPVSGSFGAAQAFLLSAFIGEIPLVYFAYYKTYRKLPEN